MMEGTHCCGMEVYTCITRDYQDDPKMSPLEHLADIIDEWCGFADGGLNGAGIVVFADVKGKYIESDMDPLIKFIRKNKLGTMAVGRWKNNPNSSNRVRAVTWNVNLPKTRALVRKEFPDRIVRRAVSYWDF